MQPNSTLDLRSKCTTLVGRVKLVYGDVTITGDKLTWCNQQAVVSGNVILQLNGDTLSGDRLTYDPGSGSGTLKTVYAQLSVPNVHGPVYLVGSSLDFDQSRGDLVIHDAKFSTCTCKDPAHPDFGYYLATKTMTIRPGDRLSAHAVRFVESGLTLFYWPSVTLPLGSDNRSTYNRWEFPTFGYSYTKGYYVSEAYDYQVGSDHQTRFLIDVMQKLGTGLGISQNYRVAGVGQGAVSVYHLHNQSTGHQDWQLAWSDTLDLPAGSNGSLQLAYQSRGTSAGEVRTLGGGLHLSQSSATRQASLDISHTQTRGAVLGWTNTVKTQFDQQLDTGWQLHFDGNLDERNPAPAPAQAELIGYRAALSKQWRNLKATASVSQEYEADLAGSTAVSVPWTQLTRLPELSLDASKLSILGDNQAFDWTTTVGRYAELPSEISATRLDSRLTLNDQYIGRATQLVLGGWGRASAYSTGDDRLAFHSKVGLRFNALGPFQLGITYHYLDQLGATPFAFDRLSPDEGLDGSLGFKAGLLSASVSSGYDFLSKAPKPASGTLSLGNQVASVSVSGSYDLVGQDLTTLGGSAQVKLDAHHDLQLGATYNVITHAVSKFDGRIDWQIPGWELALSSIYDVADKTVDSGKVTLTRRLDCRNISLSYDKQSGEIWLGYQITALPAAVDIGATTGSSGPGVSVRVPGWENLFR